MRLSLAALLVTAPLSAYLPSLPIEDSKLLEAFEEGHFAQALERCDFLLKSGAAEDKGEILLNYATAYLLDQQPEKAFETFLDALAAAKIKEPSPPSLEELELYDKALAQYLQADVEDLRWVSQDIRDAYAPMVAMNQDYYLLNFVVALAHANVTMYDDFFAAFYRSYCSYPDHYMTHKTLALVYLKLMESARERDARQERRRQVMVHLNKAIERCSKDYGLYRTMIVLARGMEKKRYLEEYLPHILSEGLVIPRSDLYLLVRESTDVGLYDLAQKLVDRGRACYEYSRSLNAAAQYLEGHRETAVR